MIAAVVLSDAHFVHKRLWLYFICWIWIEGEEVREWEEQDDGEWQTWDYH